MKYKHSLKFLIKKAQQEVRNGGDKDKLKMLEMMAEEKFKRSKDKTN